MYTRVKGMAGKEIDAGRRRIVVSYEIKFFYKRIGVHISEKL